MGHVRDRMDADLRLIGHAESTRESYLGCAQRFVKFFMTPPDQLGEEDVRRFMLHLTEKRRLSVGTRLVYVGAIKFLFAITLKMPEVVEGIPWPKRKRRRPIVPTRDEVARLLQAASSRYWWTFFLVAYAAGLRRMEVAALRAENIDSRAGLIHLEVTKGGDRRSVKLDPVLLVALREHWRAHHLPGPWLFPAPRGRDGWHDRPITRGAATQAFARTRERAKLGRRVTLHNLRHAYATHLHEDGVSLHTLRVLLGHKRLETTAIYTEVRTDHIRATPSLLRKLGM